MWIIFGNRVKTERVPGGRKVERHCAQCGETAMFYERRAVSTFQLYFLDVFNYKTQRVMACGACGALYATDELGAPEPQQQQLDASTATAPQQSGTLVGTLVDAAGRAGAAITAGTGRALEQLDALRREVAGEPPARRSADGAWGPPARDAQAPRADDDDDPLAAEDAALDARFAELERKARERRGE